MKIYQRYLAVNFILPFLGSTVFFIMFLLTFQLFRVMRIVITKGVPWLEVLELMGHIALSFIPMAVPISCLFASIFCLNKMSEDSEIVAMRSFGTKAIHLIMPFMAIGLVISAVVHVLNQDLIPYSKQRFKNTIVKLTSRGMLNSIKSGQFFTEIPDITLFADKVEDDGATMYNVFIHSQKAANGEQQIIGAKKGKLLKQSTSADEQQSSVIRFHLEDGNIIKISDGYNDFQKILFKEYDFPINLGQVEPEFVNKYTMRRSKELAVLLKEEKDRIKELAQLPQRSADEEKELNGLRENLPRIELEYWSRFNTPLQCLIFIFLGVGLGVKQGRGTSRNSAGLAIVVLVLYFALFFVGVSVARKGTVPAMITVFTPTVLASLVGLRFYRKLDWVS
jgi:lipopolysaccharide export system permease protein